MLHLDFLSLVVLVILLWIPEGLVGLELLSDHPLDDSVMWELFLKLKELLALLPHVVGLCKLFQLLLVELCLRFLGFKSLLTLPLLLNLNCFLIVNVFLDDL